jgi:ABC-type multidrug transport system ATPase subunit
MRATAPCLEPIIGSVVALIATSSLRVDVGGVPVFDGLSLASTGDWVLVLGAARALFEAAAGLRSIERGEIRVEGLEPLQAVRAGTVASAPLDPPLPLRWTPFQYIEWSTRLAGRSRDVVTSAVVDAIERLALMPFARVKLAKSSLPVRRATVLAAALATGASTLLVEDPCVDLPPEVTRPFARMVARALAERRTAFFASRIPLESPLGLAAEEAIVVDGTRVAIQGAPAQIASSERVFALRVSGDVRAFATAVAAGGARLLTPAEHPMEAHMSLDLGPLGTKDVLRIALECSAVVLELRPLARAFA